MRSLQFGLEIQTEGFSIYVAGSPGTGRLTAVNSFITEHAKIKGPASDWCYVQNFKDPIKKGVELGPVVKSWGAFKAETKNLTKIARHRAAAARLVDEIGFNQFEPGM